jgi:hypothetical protein
MIIAILFISLSGPLSVRFDVFTHRSFPREVNKIGPVVFSGIWAVIDPKMEIWKVQKSVCAFPLLFYYYKLIN